MASINKVIIVGHLGRDPEIKYLPSGDPIANIAVATTSKWKDKSGQPKSETEWHRVSAFGKLAEIMGQYLKKGAQVYIEGKLKTRKYADKDGIDRYATEIIADQMQMIGGRQDEQKQSAPRQVQKPVQGYQGGTGAPDDFDDDLPF